MLQFTIDESRCTRCHACADDCPVNIITLQDGWPTIPQARQASCLKCFHCLAVCPTAALSILGRNPDASTPLRGAFPHATQMETLLKGRRSVRRYRDENLDQKLIDRLLGAGWHGASGHNARQVRLTVIDEREVLQRLRSDLLARIAELAARNDLPQELAYYATFPRAWERNGRDVIFRGAPHLVIASADAHCTAPLVDSVIALTGFELMAQSMGIGTLWNALAKWSFEQIMPELPARLGVPKEHRIGYVMSFGKPAVVYQRTVQHRPDIVRASY
jgi:nitroreductase/NAD-dependent dihydropyrimidine dehydrogenase PreA subunit